MNRLVLLLFAALLAGTASADSGAPYADAAVIRFANGTTIDTRSSPMPAADSRLAAGAVWLIHVSGPIRQEWLARLRRLGAEPLCYLAYQTLICRLGRNARAGDFESLEFVDWLGPHPSSAKLAPELPGNCRVPSAECRVAGNRQSTIDNRQSQTAPSPSFVLSVWPGADVNSVASAIVAAGGDVTDVTGSTVRFRLDASRLPRLAVLESVAWIQESSAARAYNSDVQWVIQVGWRPERPDEVAGRRLWAHGIRGQNMVVGLFDKGITTDHDMFVDPGFPINAPGLFPEHRKLVAYKLYRDAYFGDAGNFHGTAVAGTLCGDDSIAGNASKLDGVAPDCRLYFVDNGTSLGIYVFDSDLTALLDSVRLSRGMNEPVRQVSGSFGSDQNPSDYRLEEASLDAVCWADKEFFVVWAAGNSVASSYAIGHPSGAKNALTVGACGNATLSNTVWSSSARGPCRDERIKPNLLAPGQDVATADGREYHSYVSASGTSISAPAVSGALMLLRQYFAEGWYPTGVPDSGHRVTRLSSALMRAMAIAATDSNVGSDYLPNAAAGWGRFDVSTILHFPDDSSGLAFLDDTTGMSTGESLSFPFELSGRAPLHVVLAWTDTAAAPEAAIAIINDLDLELVSPDGNLYRGNQLYEGWSLANPPNRDERNVEEVCRVNHPLPGRWTARVRGRNVYTARQPLAIAVRGGIAGMVPGISEAPSAGLRRLSFGLQAFTGLLRPGSRLTVFTIDGRQVFGSGNGVWTGNDNRGRPLGPGVYFYRVVAGSAPPVTGKLVIAR